MLSPSALFGALSRRAAPAAVAWLTLSAACSASQPASDPLGLSDDEIAALQPPVPTPPPRSPQNHERTIGPWPQGNAGLDGTVPTMPAGFGTKRIYLETMEEVLRGMNKVIIDGKVRAMTPFSGRLEIRPGRHSLTLRRPGYHPSEEIVEVPRDHVLHVDYVLQPEGQPGSCHSTLSSVCFHH